MAPGGRRPTATQPSGLAGRGIRDEELAVIRRLAGNAGLLDLSGDPALLGIARPLLAACGGQSPWSEEAGRFMGTEASEHRELVDMLARDMSSEADALLRHHISRSAPASAAARPGSAPRGA